MQLNPNFRAKLIPNRMDVRWNSLEAQLICIWTQRPQIERTYETLPGWRKHKSPMLLGSGQTSRWRASVWLEQVAYHCNEADFSCKAIFSFLRIGVVTEVQVRDRFEPGSTNQDFGEPGSMKCSLGSRPCLLADCSWSMDKARLLNSCRPV